MSKQNIAHIPHPYLWGPTDRWTPFYSLFRDSGISSQQGMSKDVIVVSSWPTGGLATMFKNWEYVVLSHVRTLSGLYLVEPIDMDKLQIVQIIFRTQKIH
jgi:hypothetical protein